MIYKQQELMIMLHVFLQILVVFLLAFVVQNLLKNLESLVKLLIILRKDLKNRLLYSLCIIFLCVETRHDFSAWQNRA